jgi:hypothetical protein
LVAREIGGVPCCNLAAATNVFIETSPVTGNVGAHGIHLGVIAVEVPIVVPQVLALVIAAVPHLAIGGILLQSIQVSRFNLFRLRWSLRTNSWSSRD